MDADPEAAECGSELWRVYRDQFAASPGRASLLLLDGTGRVLQA